VDSTQKLPQALQDLQVWYHPPDYRYGNKELRALLQLAKDDQGKLYFRSFHTDRMGTFVFEKSGEAVKGNEAYDIWTGMNWKFRVADYLPQAMPEDNYVPVDLRPGSEREGFTPAIRCKITVPGKKPEEVPIAQTVGGFTPVKIDDKTLEIGYHVKTEDLGFSLKLLRAEQTNDPGTQSAATYTSFVQLFDKERKIDGEDHVITMNAPLEHRGYKFYQSGYVLIDVDRATQKPVSRSVFTCGYDPGIWLKYLGQIMLGLGIVTMFYMKAYFFKPRSRPAPAPTPTADDGPSLAEV